MKKILLAAAATSVLASSSAFAEMNGEFYGQLSGGFNKLEKTKGLKSENSGHVSVGVGYYVNEMFRADLEFDHLFEPDFKGSLTKSGVKYNAKADVDLNALMLNAYADLFDAGMAKFYAGAGVGAARNKVKLNLTPVGSTTSSNANAKEKTEFAYALHVGASAEFAPGVNGFLQYSWKDYGQSKDLVNASKVNFGKAKFRGHHGSVGVRVDF